MFNFCRVFQFILRFMRRCSAWCRRRIVPRAEPIALYIFPSIIRFSTAARFVVCYIWRTVLKLIRRYRLLPDQMQVVINAVGGS